MLWRRKGNSITKPDHRKVVSLMVDSPDSRVPLPSHHPLRVELTLGVNEALAMAMERAMAE